MMEFMVKIYGRCLNDIINDIRNVKIKAQIDKQVFREYITEREIRSF